jgi:hypothetical protein
VTPGSSIQKVLVKEAKLCAAMVVVIGANKKYSFGSVPVAASKLGMIQLFIHLIKSFVNNCHYKNIAGFTFLIACAYRGSTCLAKYCARKLPPTTSVVAIQSGKAIFVREAPKPPLGE